VFSCRQQTSHNDDDKDVLKLRRRTLRPSFSLRSAPETPHTASADGETQYAERARGSPDSGSVVSPLHVFARRGVTRPVVVQHNSFNSYFRPALVSRLRCPLAPPLSSPSPEQSPEQPPPLPFFEKKPRPSRSYSCSVPSPLHRIYRKHAVREMYSSKLTPSMRQREPTADAPRSPPASGGGGSSIAMSRRSVYGRVTSGTGGALPVSLGRRNTVVGGGTVECLPSPIPLSLREIYWLSRQGSVHSHCNIYKRRQSMFPMFRSEMSSKASVGVSRLASSANKRASVGSVLSGDCDGDREVVDVRRRRSYTDSVEQNQRLARDQSSLSEEPQQSLPSRGNQDNAVDDANKTHTLDFILVSLLACVCFRKSRGSKAFIRVCVCLCVCPHDRTKKVETAIIKLAVGIVNHEVWLPI